MSLALNRQWFYYKVNAVFNTNTEKEETTYRNEKSGMKSYLFRLPQPILCRTPEMSVIVDFIFEGRRVRLYPPFILNEKGEIGGAFENVWIPEGIGNVEVFRPVPVTVPKALIVHPVVSEETFYCYGLRVDAEDGVLVNKLMNSLLDQICQYTFQWWLRSTRSPFSGVQRFIFSIGENFDVLEFESSPSGRGAWGAVREAQFLGGFEVPVDNRLWLTIGAQLSNDQPAEAGLLAFWDAVAAYMADDDERCILQLFLCVEILGNKRRRLNNQLDVEQNKLVRSTDLIDDKNRETLKKLQIDRGHIAHGRPPYILATDKNYPVEKYIEAVLQLMENYLNKIYPHQWPTATRLKLGRAKKAH